MSTGKKVTFKPPAGAVPEGTAEGDLFDLVTTYQLESGGTVCVKVMGEVKMSGYGDRQAEKARPSYQEEASAMTASAPASPPSEGGGYG